MTRPSVPKPFAVAAPSSRCSTWPGFPPTFAAGPAMSACAGEEAGMTGTLEAEARAQGVELDPLLREVNASPPVFWKRAKRVSIATMRLLGGSGVILYAGLLVYGLLARVEV